ncbi:very short patch repair endonuclease [Methylophilus sp.]|uniref:very short patch repair endonuclease n=1 Tax=Methylophilus sp. TaxID=29541 RepID=UPI0011DC33A6|nr:very short patch repair endonuclease [Methylophilus sp.]TXI47153.1 MAG: DNA mismatch endonuclease Vsr [Methylophilus sp.]
MVDTVTSEQRSWNMSKIKGKNTHPELLLRSLLHKAGFRFRLHRKDLPSSPDIVLPMYRTVIFVHGCFWHRHPNCRNATMPSSRPEFWAEKFKQNLERDARNSAALVRAGWKVYIVWECELRSKKEEILERLSESIRSNN